MRQNLRWQNEYLKSEIMFCFKKLLNC
jgi:hypothetical protein